MIAYMSAWKEGEGMSLEAQAAVGGTLSTRVSTVRELLSKAAERGLTASESIMLKGELARIEARVAAVNARIGTTVVELGPFARMADQAGASAALAV